VVGEGLQRVSLVLGMLGAHLNDVRGIANGEGDCLSFDNAIVMKAAE
jgi:hypothetical protein